MARVAGVDLPPNKRAEIGLTYIYGIGRTIMETMRIDAADTITILGIGLRVHMWLAIAMIVMGIIGAFVGNALFALTGQRVRTLPFARSVAFA